VSETPPDPPVDPPAGPPESLPPIPQGTPPDDVITALGFVPGDTRAVVITSDGVVAVAASIPDVEDPLDPFAAAEPQKTGAPRPMTKEAHHAHA